MLARLSILGALVALAGGGWVLGATIRSPYGTREGVPIVQPVPFSHEHHVAGLGIDCRYCHTSVETSASAGYPPTRTCMGCHSYVWADSPMLEPVRASWRRREPIAWTRVYDLPDYVFFNHSIHVAKGVGCETCHGRIDRMPVVYKANELTMKWCLDCHRAPERHLRPREEVFTMGYEPSRPQSELGPELKAAYRIRPNLTECYTCHR
jgi:hypothetical protein